MSEGHETPVRSARAAVSIRRDRRGIPHIEAANEHDAWLAMGWASAADRLWQMEWYRRRGEGRWAEVAGPAGVADDVLFRRLALAPAARAEVEAMSAETRAMFEAYAEGVNSFVDSGSPLPPELALCGLRFEPWRPWHSVLLFKVRHAVMGKAALKLARMELLRRVGAETYALLESGSGRDEPLILAPGARGTGGAGANPAALERALRALGGPASRGDASNSWAVHGRRTTTGAPVLCNDSHRPLDVPNVYWQCHVATPEWNVAGGAFPGFPAFPHFGFNGRVGWNITHAMADTEDLYLERFDPARPDRYLTEEGWRVAEVSSSTVSVRGAAAVECEVVRTRHGTVIEGDSGSGQAVVLRSTATDRPSCQWECLRPMLAAGTVSELFEAQRGWCDPVNNLVAADSGGAIGYLTRGRLPVRSGTAARELVVPGWTGEHEWTHDVPFDEMPRSLDPPEGFVLTANQRIRAGESPYVAHEFAVPGRAERIRELLAGREAADPAAIIAIQADTISVRARGWARVLSSLPAAEGDGERARALLAAWDGNLEAQGAAGLLYACFKQELARAAFAPIVGEETWAWITAGDNPGAERLLERWLYELGVRAEAGRSAPGEAEWERMLGPALKAAWARAGKAARSGDPRRWSWARVHRCRPQHPLSPVLPDARARLDPPAFGLGGDSDTIKVASFRLVPALGFQVQDVSVYRQAIDFAAGRMWWSIPGGASGIPGSPHRDDQVRGWRSARLISVAFEHRAVVRAARSSLVLAPPRLG